MILQDIRYLMAHSGGVGAHGRVSPELGVPPATPPPRSLARRTAPDTWSADGAGPTWPSRV